MEIQTINKHVRRIENNANCLFRMIPQFMNEKARALSGDQTQCLLIASQAP